MALNDISHQQRLRKTQNTFTSTDPYTEGVSTYGGNGYRKYIQEFLSLGLVREEIKGHFSPARDRTEEKL